MLIKENTKIRIKIYWVSKDEYGEQLELIFDMTVENKRKARRVIKKWCKYGKIEKQTDNVMDFYSDKPPQHHRIITFPIV